MPEYRVRWEIDIEADTPVEAAARALIVQRDTDPANTATVFGVVELVALQGVIQKPAQRIDLGGEIA